MYKGSSRKTGAVYALKKILMHNEKDGVYHLHVDFDLYIFFEG